MPRRQLRLLGSHSALEAGFEAIRRELKVVESFPPEVLEAATVAAERPTPSGSREDATGIPFVTVDPPGSLDLDQAFFLERQGKGFCVHYAIADVGHFVQIGDAVDEEARRRVETLYGPDMRVPLHPPVLSEDAASLLPDKLRPALHWCLTLDEDGELTDTSVRRSLVRSREKLDYATVQQRIDRASADESLALLKTIGELRMAAEARRGGIDVGRPEQEVVPDNNGWTLTFRTPLASERWNAQLSLLTGMAAAAMMLEARLGVLRTLPPPDGDDVRRLHATAKALGIDWPDTESYAQLIRGLDRGQDHVAAFLAASSVLLRGAGYTAFDGDIPDQPDHGAVAAPYAHTTAPLRRLVDRFVGELCTTLHGGDPVPDALRTALPLLPALMAAGDHRAGTLDRECVNLVEAAILQPRIGEVFCGVVVNVRHDDDKPAGGTVQLADPAALAPCRGRLELGQRINVRLVEASVDKRSVAFEQVT